jgi:hypothetical protein
VRYRHFLLVARHHLRRVRPRLSEPGTNDPARSEHPDDRAPSSGRRCGPGPPVASSCDIERRPSPGSSCNRRSS